MTSNYNYTFSRKRRFPPNDFIGECYTFLKINPNSSQTLLRNKREGRISQASNEPVLL